MNVNRITNLWLTQHFASSEMQIRVTLPSKAAVQNARSVVSQYNFRYLDGDPQPIHFIAKDCEVLLIRTALPIEEIRQREKNDIK